MQHACNTRHRQQRSHLNNILCGAPLEDNCVEAAALIRAGGHKNVVGCRQAQAGGHRDIVSHKIILAAGRHRQVVPNTLLAAGRHR